MHMYCLLTPSFKYELYKNLYLINFARMIFQTCKFFFSFSQNQCSYSKNNIL